MAVFRGGSRILEGEITGVAETPSIRQFIVEVFVKTTFAKPALPTRFSHPYKVFFNVHVAFRTNVLYELVLRVTYRFIALVCVIASATMSASISSAVNVITQLPLPL